MANLANTPPSRKQRTPTSVWLRVREEYQQGMGSCAELARRHSLSAGAVSSRCKREKWRMAVTQLDQKLDQRLHQLTTAKAETLAERAARFRERALTESEGWLDQIQRAKSLVAENDTQGLKELISAWQIPVQLGAKLLRLDDAPVERPRIHISIVGELREAMRRPNTQESAPIDVGTRISKE
jgi:hypothetical protein